MGELRRATEADWAAIVELNNGELPHVSPLAAGDAARYLELAEITVVPREGAPLAAALFLMTEGVAYDSPNYRWFADRYPSFGYVDRIVVRADAAGQGLGRRLYDHAVRWTRSGGRPVLCAEVNLVPPNERSLAFHRRYGFAEVGRSVDERYAKSVAMLALDLVPAAPGDPAGRR